MVRTAGLVSLGRRALWASTACRNAILCTAWRPYSRLVLVSDGAQWVLAEELREVEGIARRLGIRPVRAIYIPGVRRQAVFYADQFFLLNAKHFEGDNRIGFAYFHGRQFEEPAFAACFRSLVRNHERIHRVQVSHSAMRELVLESGITPEKVFLIRIGVKLAHFTVQTPESRHRARVALGLPESAVVVGSFQKDGVGWGEGLEPKWIKGPDVFLEVIGCLKGRVPELFVLLAGPARGYVKAGLERLGVPYRHVFVRGYPQVGTLFQVLDVYLVTAREEGGPKSVLEAMASGVPLVTTRVGQAMDMVRHGENGWMAEVDDVEGLAHWAGYAVERRASPEVGRVVEAGRCTAEANTYDAQVPLWREFMRGFVASAHDR